MQGLYWTNRLLLICWLFGLSAGESDEEIGVVYIPASNQRTYVLISNKTVNQQDANNFCREQFSGELVVIRDEEELAGVSANLMIALRRQPGVLSPEDVTEMWVNGKTDVREHGVINVTVNPLNEQGKNCVILSNSRLVDGGLSEGFQLLSKSNCAFGERKFLCQSTPQAIITRTQNQAEFWLEGKLYKPVLNQLSSQLGANEICQRKYGGSLASITTQYLLTGVRDKLKETISGDAFTKLNTFWICGKVYTYDNQIVSVESPPTFQTGSRCVVIASRESGSGDVIYELRAKNCHGAEYDFLCVLNDTDACPYGVTRHERDVWFEDTDSRYTAILNVRANRNESQGLCSEQHGAILANVTTAEKLASIQDKLTTALTNQHRDSVDEFWVTGRTSLPSDTEIDVSNEDLTAGDNCVILSNRQGDRFALYAKDCDEVERRVICEIPIKDVLVHDYDDSSQFLFVLGHALSHDAARAFCQTQYAGDLIRRADVTKLYSVGSLRLRSQLSQEVQMFWLKQDILYTDHGTWEVHPDSNCYGYDYERLVFNTATECREYCHRTAGYVAVVWRVTSTEKLCYPKRRCSSVRRQTGHTVYKLVTGEECKVLSIRKKAVRGSSFMEVVTVPCPANLTFVCGLKIGSPLDYYYVSDQCDGAGHVTSMRQWCEEQECPLMGGVWDNTACVVTLCGSQSRNVDGWVYAASGGCSGPTITLPEVLKRTECQRLKGRSIEKGHDSLVRCWVTLCNETKEQHTSFVLSTRQACPADHVVADVTARVHRMTCRTLTSDVNVTQKEVVLVNEELKNVWYDCPMVLCQVKKDCKSTLLGETYAGTLSQSLSGKPCKRWDEAALGISSADVPDATLAEASNYCRNPDAWAEGPYCYVDSPQRFEICDLPFCTEADCASERGFIASLQDSALTGSSRSYYSPYSQSRLYTTAEGSYTGSWAPVWHNTQQYIQADLGATRRLTAVATQGRSNYNRWVTSYYVAASMAGIGYYEYVTNADGSRVLFRGNNDRNSVVKNSFPFAIIGRYVRLYPQTWYSQIALRWEVYGCDYVFNKQVETLQLSGRQFILVPGRHHDPWGYCARAYGAYGASLDFLPGGAAAAVTAAAAGRFAQLLAWLSQLSRSGAADKVLLPARVASSYPLGRITSEDIEKLSWNGDQGWCVYMHLPDTYNGTFALYAEDCASASLNSFLCERQQERFNNYEVEGGVQISGIENLEECVMLCKGDCQAAGYSTLKRACFHFNGSDSCTPGRSTPGFTYVQKAPCECHRRVSVEDGVTYRMSSGADVSNASSSQLPVFSDSSFDGSMQSVWVANASDPAPWIQVSLPAVYKVYGVMMEGVVGSGEQNDSWPTSYSLSYSRDCNKFTNYTKDVQANTSPEQSTTVLAQAFYAQCVKLHSFKFHNRLALKFDLLTCKEPSENRALGGRAKLSGTHLQHTADRAVDGFSYSYPSRAGCSITSPAVGAYFVVDLDNVYDVERVTLQGRRDCCACKEQKAYIKDRTSYQLRGSSQLSSSASYARSKLNTTGSGSYRGAWSPRYNTIGQYLQADLGAVRRLEKVATQGREDSDQWVTSYHFAYSISSSYRYDYVSKADGSKVVFSGNSDRNTVVSNTFQHAVMARYVRLYPQTWHVYIAMRWEVYGCDSFGELEDFSIKVGFNFKSSIATDESSYQLCAQMSGELGPAQQLQVECEPVVAGRFVLVKSEREVAASLAICEIEVFTSGEPLMDVAFGKPCTQNPPSIEPGYRAGLAVDGQTKNLVLSTSTGSCSRTGSGLNPWWRVDLQQSFAIQAIAITPRACCDGNLRNLALYVGDDENTYIPCTTIPGRFRSGETKVVTCNSKMEGRFVKIVMEQNTYMSLCEVQVYAKEADILTYGGNGDRRQCIFPFTYKNKTYDGCTEEGRTKPWCAVTTNYSQDALWGYCMDVRLRDGRHGAEGRVEMLIDDKWQNVCDDGFNDVTADVICRQLGFSGGTAAFAPKFPPGKLLVLVNDVACRGNESALRDCSYTQRRDHFCLPSEAAAVICNAYDGMRVYGEPAYARGVLDTRVDATVLLRDPLRVPGFIGSWHFYAKTANKPVSLQVWRRQNDPQNLRYMLVGHSPMKPNRTGYFKIVAPQHSVRVEPGDLIGLSFTNENPIPYDPSYSCDEHTTVLFSKHAEGRVGSIHTFVDKEEDRLSCRLYSLFVKVQVENIVHLHEFRRGNQYYRVFLQQFAVRSADPICVQHMGQGAHLARLASSLDAQVIQRELILMGANGTFWLTNNALTDGALLAGLRWASCQPEEGKRCIAVSNTNARGEFLWYTKPCHEQHFIICQKEIPLNESVTVSTTTPAPKVAPKVNAQVSNKHVVLPIVLPIVLILLVLAVVLAIVLVNRYLRKRKSASESLVQSVSYHSNAAGEDDDYLHVDASAISADEQKMTPPFPPATDDAPETRSSYKRLF